MTQYGAEVKFKNEKQFHEAWMYLMRTCQGFRYCNHPGELTVEPALCGDARDDADTAERLQWILNEGYKYD